MTVPSPAADSRAALARRLRDLRLHHWPRRTVTQRMVAEGLGRERTLSLSLISAWENDSKPTVPPPARLHDYATFFATERSVTTGRGQLIPEDDLTTDEIAARDELYSSLLSLRTEPADLPAATAETPMRFDWRFPDRGNIRIVCGKLDYLDDPKKSSHPYTDPKHVNYTDLLTFADTDALVELFGHLRMVNPENDIRFFRSDRLEEMADSADQLASHLVLLGGIAPTSLMGDVLRLGNLASLNHKAHGDDRQNMDPSNLSFPIRQVATEDEPYRDNGEIFQVADGRDFRSTFSEGKLVNDVGLLARVPNPFNSFTTLTICSGIFASGVVGAVRTLTDEKLRRRNESYLVRRFSGANQFAMLMRVSVVAGAAMTPDMQNESTRMFEWSDNEVPGTSRDLERAG
jgi:hypothetical protein